MPAGTFIIHDTTVRDVSSWLRFTIESQGWQINEQFRKRDEVVIKGVTRSKLGAWKWHRFVPFGKWMKRGQRVGIEVHVKPCAYGVLLGIAVVPYMELFDAKEIFLLTQGLADHCVDNKYSEET